MKERIHKHLITLLFTVVLISMLANCVRYKLDNPVQPVSRVIEAPIGQTIRAAVTWLWNQRGRGGQKGSAKSPMPAPTK